MQMSAFNLFRFNQPSSQLTNRTKHPQTFIQLNPHHQQSTESSQIISDVLAHKISSAAELLERRIASLQSFLGLADMRRTGQLCDAEIQVDDGTVFKVHRVILIAASGFFRAMFTNGMRDASQTRVLIREIDSDVMEAVIEWAYTRKVVISQENIERLLPAADRLQMLILVENCTDFLRQSITSENVIGIWRFAACYSASQLECSAFQYLM